ncbi:hypothetical protein B0T17DRAFT_545115 [Bombardia bombarda]|uniref:Uncharacterized protein n=1 Tax=Bombardia bombarda TaxID=252184 RepID=A0AA39TMK8_9PEZI|nr:hypothetical protein B0T17DRAFT_545115 [Bombardia bombarda]
MKLSTIVLLLAAMGAYAAPYLRQESEEGNVEARDSQNRNPAPPPPPPNVDAAHPRGNNRAPAPAPAPAPAGSDRAANTGRRLPRSSSSSASSSARRKQSSSKIKTRKYNV